MSDYDYKIVSDYAAGSLEGKVKELLKDGYAPAGGICFVPDGSDSGLLHQAMYRKTPATRKPNRPAIIFPKTMIFPRKCSPVSTGAAH